MTMSNHPIKSRCRAAFTLVELLLVIAIIGVLASLALAVVAGAQDEARRSATVARLGQIRAMVLNRIEGYEFRRLPVRLKDFGVGTGQDGLLYLRRVTNRIIADMINVELPRKGSQMDQPAFPSKELRGWLNDPNNPNVVGVDVNALILDLESKRSMIVIQLEQIMKYLDSPSEGLAFVLSTTDVDGTTGVDALGSKAFIDIDVPPDGLMSVVDAWNEEIKFYFYLTDEHGNLYMNSDGPRDLSELVRDVNVEDIPIHNIVVEFETTNPL